MTPISRRMLDLLEEGIVLADAAFRLQACNLRARQALRLPAALTQPGEPLARLLATAFPGGPWGDPADALETLSGLAIGACLSLAPEAELHRLDDGVLLRFGVRADRSGVDTAEATELATLRQRCADYEEVFEHLPQGVTMLDDKLDMVVCNKRFNELMRIPPQLGRRGTSFEAFMRFNAERGEYGPGDVEEQVRQRVELASLRVPHRFTRTRPDGSAVEVHGIPVPRGGFVSTYTDVSAQHRAETALRQLQEAQERLIAERTAELRQREAELAEKTALLERTLEHMDQGISMFNAELVLVVVNSKALEMLGFPVEVCHLGASFEAMTRFNAERGEYGPGDVEEQVRQRIELARHPQPHCFERVRPDGQIIEIRGTPLQGGGFVTIYTDVTARRAAETQLRETLDELERRVEQRTAVLRQQEAELAHKTALLEATVENISQGISLFDGDLKLLVHNRKFLDLLAFPDPLGQAGTPLEAFFRLNAERGEYGPGEISELVATRLDMARHPTPHRFRRERPNGTVIEVQGTPLPAQIGGFVTTYADVTDLVRAKEQAEAALGQLKFAQEQLVQAEKMASLGQLVAGIAHEINTPVGIALTAVSYLEEETRKLDACLRDNAMKKSDLVLYLATADEATRLVATNLRRAADLIQNFKQVAVDQTSEERRRFNLAAYLDEVLQSHRPEFKKVPHRIELDCPADLVVDSYPGALWHVFSNLLFNALVHGSDGVRPVTIRIAARRDGDQVAIRFSDDGKGIAAEHLGRIFDPFFTTRRGSGGSGLGLHVVFNSVTASLRGSIRCESEPGAGTSFFIRIPLSLATDATPSADAADKPAA